MIKIANKHRGVSRVAYWYGLENPGVLFGKPGCFVWNTKV